MYYFFFLKKMCIRDSHNKRQALAFITKEDVTKKLFDEIAPKYADRNGGYTRIIKIGPRLSLIHI